MNMKETTMLMMFNKLLLLEFLVQLHLSIALTVKVQ